MVVDALGETVDQAVTAFEDPGSTMKILIFSAAQETGLHFGGKRAVSQSEFGFDGEPHGDIGCGHEHRTADDSARTFKNLLEGNKDGALALADVCESESIASCERDSGE